jgi:hypothetical protein
MPEVFATGPQLWVKQPRTQMYQPYWGGRVSAALVNALHKRDLSGLTTDQLLVLLLAEIVVPQADGTRLPRSTTPAPGVHHLGRVLAPLQIAALRRHFRAVRDAGMLTTDDHQVVGQRDGIYCEPVALFLQKSLSDDLSMVLGSPVSPSYTWVFRYRTGARLDRHVDRPQCRWNVSLCLDADSEGQVDWPLCFDVDGRDVRVNLQLGEAVLYSGTETPHWRRELTGHPSVTMAFLHYVDPGFVGGRN